MNRILGLLGVVALISSIVLGQNNSAQNSKPKLTLDEFFNVVGFDAVKMAPDGSAVVIATERADWEQQIFRKDLWLYRFGDAKQGASLVQMTNSGKDSDPEWSPDGKWIAFLSERKTAGAKDEDSDANSSKDETAQLYLISPAGGEAFAVTSGSEEVDAFAWAADSKALYFATKEPWSKQRGDDHKKDWKDVKQYRGDERGDVIYRIGLDEALKRGAEAGTREIPDEEKDANATQGAVEMVRIAVKVAQMTVAHDGSRMAFVTNSPSERQERMDDIEIFTIDLGGSGKVSPKRLTNNQAHEGNLEWATDNRHVFFRVDEGSVEGKYADLQPRVYWVDADSGKVERWLVDFPGEVVRYSALPDGSVLCACRIGTEVQMYTQASLAAKTVKREGWAGTYETSSATAGNRGRIAFSFSTTEKPMEIYVSESIDKLTEARAITSFNNLLTERDLPQAKPYRWKTFDGTEIEGMLMYPPGKFEAKNLPMFVFVHGGPADADGNHFEADWYQWDRLAATQGWLVFEPNYRGSTGYGDKFTLAVAPEAFSGPGKDILLGVDALAKDGIADENRLAVGGYSYGGYMTNWLITQTTRFKAAVTGAGGVENVADWGNDDSLVDDTFFMGGKPWEVPQRYDSEAAIFQINKVKTPTHMVAGGDDIRVPPLESYLLDRALHDLGVPHELLIFPGEGHDLGKNPWHGKIKVREELKWLSKYGGVGE